MEQNYIIKGCPIQTSLLEARARGEYVLLKDNEGNIILSIEVERVSVYIEGP